MRKKSTFFDASKLKEKEEEDEKKRKHMEKIDEIEIKSPEIKSPGSKKSKFSKELDKNEVDMIKDYWKLLQDEKDTDQEEKSPEKNSPEKNSPEKNSEEFERRFDRKNSLGDQELISHLNKKTARFSVNVVENEA